MDECQFCKTREVLEKIMEIIENEISEIGVDFYDNPITELYNAADNAKDTWRCMCNEYITT